MKESGIVGDAGIAERKHGEYCRTIAKLSESNEAKVLELVEMVHLSAH